METDRDRVWAAVIQLSNEQAGFSRSDIATICEELYADDVPAKVIDETVEAMTALGVIEAVGVETAQPCYILPSDFDDA